MTAIERAVLSGLAVTGVWLATSAALPIALAGTTPDGGLPASATGPTPSAADPSGALVASGEHIPDAEKLISALDRRSPVNALAFSPDGALIVSGSEDRVVRVWHIATSRLIRRLEGHSSEVTAVAFSPDGTVIASASNDRTVRLWDAPSGRWLRTLQGHVYHVYAVAFDPHGRWLATASWDRTLALWDVKSGALLRKLRGPSAPVRAIDFSPDGKTLASGSDDRSIRLWNVETGQGLRVLEGHAGAVSAIRFRPDGQALFSGSADRSARMWRLSDGAMVRKVGECSASVLSLAVSANGQILGAACGAAGSVLWDIPTGAELPRPRGDSIGARTMAFSPDGTLVATGSDDGSIVVEEVATGSVLTTLSASVAQLLAVAASPDGRSLATAPGDQGVLVWRDTGDHRALYGVLASGRSRALAFSPDGKSIVTGGEDGSLAIWNLNDKDSALRRSGHEGPVSALAFTPDGRILVSAGEDATVRLENLGKGTEAKVLKGHLAAVRALAVSPDGGAVASASDDATVRVWDTATGRSLSVLKSHRAPVTSVAFSADGKYMVTGSQDRTIDVWLRAKGKLLRTLRKEASAGVVALAMRGGQILSASSDGTLSLWDLGGNRAVVQSAAQVEAVRALAVAPDGATFVSASRDGVLRVWDSKTLERRWSLAGSAQQRWVACNDLETCWRREDGTLLGRVGEQGDIIPVSPSDDAHRTALAVAIDWKKLGYQALVMEGRTVSIPVRIENRGRHPAYWVNLAQSVARSAASKTSLVLIPPPTIPVLAPSASVEVVCEVSALGPYEDPQPHADTLRLAVTSASAQPVSVEIPVRVDVPHVKLRGLTVTRGPVLAVVASMTEVSMAQLQPVRLQVGLVVEGESSTSLPPIAIEQAFHGQDLALSFPLPSSLHLNRQSRATLTVRKSTHPAHVWTVAHSPVHIPVPFWLWALLVGGVVGLGLTIWQVRLYARARPLGRMARRLARLAMALVVWVAKVIWALVLIRSTLRSLRAHLERRAVAGIFFRLQPETQCSHLARQLGASWAAVAGGQAVFELQLGAEVPLNVERCLLILAGDVQALDAATAYLDLAPAGQDDGQDAIVAMLSEVPRSELANRPSSRRHLVVLNKTTMNRVLRAPRPALAFAQVVSEQVDRARVSLYQSAVVGGRRQPFYGRKAELRRLAVDPRKNYLVIGPHGIGKTSLLDEIHRRFRGHPVVECHYLSLADGDLASALADALEMPGEQSLGALLERLRDLPDGKKAVVLCDDADAWATRDAGQGGVELQALATLNQEHGCCFILAGFLGLLHAARPLPGRKPVGDVVRIETLDAETCAELATVPMAALNAHYIKADLVELIARESGGMPSLLVAICDQVAQGLAPDQRTIDRGTVEGAFKSEPVARAITAWRPRFGLQEPRLATLDQTVVLSAIFKARFTLQELASTLASLGVEATAAEIEHSARRLVAACVLEQWIGHFRFRVPLFQTVMQEATLARMITP
jgi:WD40 repeat protein